VSQQLKQTLLWDLSLQPQPEAGCAINALQHLTKIYCSRKGGPQPSMLLWHSQ